MPKSLQPRKRQLVQNAIYDAAIELFAKRGFDETTVEEVAEAAGISRRSFFRYFESKDDLLALNTVNCGEVLRSTVTSCPASLDRLDVMRETVFAGVEFTKAQPHTRQIIEISRRSASARQAHLSRLMEVQDRLAAAFSAREKARSQRYMRPVLLAGISQLIINTATASWFLGHDKDLTTAVEEAFVDLARLFCNEPVSLGPGSSPAVKSSPSDVPKKSRKKK